MDHPEPHDMALGPSRNISNLWLSRPLRDHLYIYGIMKSYTVHTQGTRWSGQQQIILLNIHLKLFTSVIGYSLNIMYRCAVCMVILLLF